MEEQKQHWISCQETHVLIMSLPPVNVTLNKLRYGYCLSLQVLHVGLSGAGVKGSLGCKMFLRHRHLTQRKESKRKQGCVEEDFELQCRPSTALAD